MVDFSDLGDDVSPLFFVVLQRVVEFSSDTQGFDVVLFGQFCVVKNELLILSEPFIPIFV